MSKRPTIIEILSFCFYDVGNDFYLDLELTLGSKVFRLKQGETIHFDSETKHKLRNISDEKCELMVTLYTP